MKTYNFNLDKYVSDKFFRPIRNKVQIIEVLMEAIKYIILNPDILPENITGEMILKIDKMSRLFFFNKDKYFSISFPFFVRTGENNKYFFYSNNIGHIDNELISKVTELISCDEFRANCSLDFIEPISDYEDKHNKDFWIFLRELMLMEDGYIRYDYDEKNYNEFKKRGEEHKHPLNHYDLFYSSKCTFKLGLKNRISKDDLIDLLNISTDCKYLSNK